MSVEKSFENMKGRKLRSVDVEAGQRKVMFEFQDGGKTLYEVAGDCCSYSWIEHLEAPKDINGATVLGAEDGGPITQDHPDHDDDHRDATIAVYNTYFHTDKGDIVLEYRNSSNGYYGGYLVLIGEELPTDQG